ncbi:MAG TPA: acetyl-CoA carboxylase biotin carboxyl carrier protein [Candidatus Acidoferrales bacterium]|nr:acetyl-CoA carboxylase biotin carboxyl carrier protein [Candidatus Acidoferrales bacterium]
MNQKELKELIEFLIEKDISEFELERGDVKVRIKRGADAQPVSVITPMAAVPAMPPMTAPAPVTPASATPAPAAASQTPAVPAQAEEELHLVKSPIVGTFYEAPGPGAPPFVKPGDTVQAGQVLCIIEAMKLMNEIESDMAGEVVKILAANGKPVEYGQPLFSIRPRK